MTIDQALKQGVEAHKAGQLQEADILYTAILKAQPKHPDANHNMGVLAVSVGKVEQGLLFFRTALEANSNTAHFWFSYIDALIKLERLADAKAVFDLAKSKGVQVNSFEQFEKRLNNPNGVPVKSVARGQAAEQVQPNILDNLKLDQALKLAKKNTKEGSLEEAKRIYKDVLAKFPKNKRAILGYQKLKAGITSKEQLTSDPSHEKLQELSTLNSLEQFKEVLSRIRILVSIFPKSVALRHIQATANTGLKNYDAAIESYQMALQIKPDYFAAYFNVGNILYTKGDLDTAIKKYKKALSLNPDYAEAYISMGVALSEQGKPEEAIDAYKKVLALKPYYAEAYFSMGSVFKDQGKIEEAIEAYKKALALKPDYAEAYNNLGIALDDQGKQEEAIEAFTKVLSLQPDHAESHYNLGVVLREQGKLEEAIEAYKKALALQPDYAEAYNNLGIALDDQGKLEEAIEAYKKALALRPDYAHSAWNLSGTAENINESKNWVEQCLKIDPSHIRAKLTLSALQFYEGDKSGFNAIKQPFKEHPLMRSFIWAFELPKLPVLYFHRWALFDSMIALSKKARPFYEFGVFKGEAFQYLINTFKKGYGFDTFSGIPEDWHDLKAGTYSSYDSIPKIEGGDFIVGKFEDTLPGFFSEPRPMASIINFDADLYSSTICALNFSKPVIDQHTILIFDEFLVNENWEKDEYKALNEFCFNNNYTYEVLAISFFTKQAAVRLIGI
tara:strand:+ start:371 stop:2557 length:2187 start_codon:yes stop_codon:yes gene_type:complete